MSLSRGATRATIEAMAKTEYQSVDDYIAAQPAPARPALERVRATIREALPRATEGISYQIPVYKLDGAMVLYFAGHQHHYAIYPATSRLLDAMEKELAGLLHSKATLRFAYDDPVPARLITRIAKLRAAEASDVQKERAAKKVAKKTANKAAPKKAKPKARKKPAKSRSKRR